MWASDGLGRAAAARQEQVGDPRERQDSVVCAVAQMRCCQRRRCCCRDSAESLTSLAKTVLFVCNHSDRLISRRRSMDRFTGGYQDGRRDG
jgi:hypothetical protein